MPGYFYYFFAFLESLTAGLTFLSAGIFALGGY